MTMEERSSGIEDGTPIISTGATITSSHISNNAKIKHSEVKTEASYPLQRTIKRSFDVAFLVAPDEKLIRRQTEKLGICTSRLINEAARHYERTTILEDYNDDSREYDQNDKIPQNLTIKHFESIEASNKYKIRRTNDIQSIVTSPTLPKKRVQSISAALSLESPVQPYVGSLRLRKTPSPPEIFQRNSHTQKVFNDENSSDRSMDQTLALVGPRSKINCDSISCPDRLQGDSRSAFTKVNLAVQRSSLLEVSPVSSGANFDDGTASPRSSVSPDLITYQNSLSPPIGQSTNSGNMSAFNSKYPTSFTTKMPYPFLISPDSQQSAILDNLKLSQQLVSQPPPKVPSPKIPVAGFRSELPSAVYPNLPYNPLSAVFPPIGDALSRPRFLAAGLLSSPFAALALPAQNVCAKCNLSFRMTSDLVYHMRSHHKSESAGEAARRRREEKLRCPVCDESFRERHHLTRHMTAHQDKESDAMVDQVELKRRTAPATLVHGK